MTQEQQIAVYSNGIFHCSVCVPKDMPREEVERQVNAENPAGTTNGWKICADPTFASGAANPHECERSTERLHYLMDC